MKNRQKIICLIFEKLREINNETLEENKSERTFQTPCGQRCTLILKFGVKQVDNEQPSTVKR
mgnify:CR=1 FL=1